MKKILVLAALIGGMVTAAPLPAMADTVVPAHCAILPLLKAECRDAISAAANDAGKVTVVATGKVGNTRCRRDRRCGARLDRQRLALRAHAGRQGSLRLLALTPAD